MSYEEATKMLMTHPRERDVFYRLAILGYQVGDIQKGVVYRSFYGSEGIHKEIEIAIADAIAQLKVLCLLLNVDFEECDALGLSRLWDFVHRRLFVPKNKEALL